MSAEEHIGTLVGDTGGHRLQIALRDSFSARRGEFVKVQHSDRRGDPEAWVLGRIVSIRRESVLFHPSLGEGLSEVSLVSSGRTGETCFANLELIGYKDPSTGEIRLPRRPLTPGRRVFGVDHAFLSEFYEYTPDSAVHLGHLVGYERGSSRVPIYVDIDRIVTEHLAVLAMTGAGKSYTVGRLIERMLVNGNASIVIFDPHGEYGAAYRSGVLNFNPLENVERLEDREELDQLRKGLNDLQQRGGGIKVYSPRDPQFARRYNGENIELALQLDNLDPDEIADLLPDLSEPQQRVLAVAVRYWIDHFTSPRDVNTLLRILTEDLDALRHWDQLYEAERKALNDRSASIVSVRLRRLLMEARCFYEGGSRPLDIREMVGRLNPKTDEDRLGRMAIIDLQGIPRSAMQLVVALIGIEILKGASDKDDPTRPVFLVIEEGHTFAPAKEKSVARPIIKKITAEGRKFGVGVGIISQRPSKLDADITSQCNTIIAMRIKNPDDQAFIRSSSDFFSEEDIRELPSLSTGEALISGRAILAPLIVKVGPKVLRHGGESPRVSATWRGGKNGPA